jgi:hypothetical protein
MMSEVTQTPAQLETMHAICLQYRDLVRSGGTPTKEQDDVFRYYSDICYKDGIATRDEKI